MHGIFHLWGWMILRVDLKIKGDINGATGFNLRGYSAKAAAGITKYMSEKAHQMETYAKQNHPWTNRTGNAEAGLHAHKTSSGVGWSQTIELKHSVYYGVYLEYSMGKRFAIIEPTIRVFSPRLMSEISAIF